MRALALVLVVAGSAGADELTYEQAVQSAMTRNERAGIAERTREAFAAGVAQARAAFLPSLTATGTYTRRSQETVRNVGGVETTIQTANALNANATLGLTLFDARAFPLYRQALRESEAQDARSQNSVRLLGFEAGNAYLTALGAAQVVEASRRRLELSNQVRDVARARFAAQLVRSTDVTRADLEVATAEQALTQAQGELTSARLALGYLAGVPVDGPLVEPAELLAAAAAGPQATPAPREQRLDVVAARRHAAALRESAREPLMRYLPSLALSAQARATNEPGLNGRELDWSLSLIATWRIFDGGLALGERRARVAEAAAAGLEADALSRGVELDVARARVALESGQATVKQAAAALEAAQKNAREIELLYRQGLAAALDVADANLLLFEAEIASIRARYTVALAYLDVRAALGEDALGRHP